jgi:hypothetical protein
MLPLDKSRECRMVVDVDVERRTRAVAAHVRQRSTRVDVTEVVLTVVPPYLRVLCFFLQVLRDRLLYTMTGPQLRTPMPLFLRLKVADCNT